MSNAQDTDADELQLEVTAEAESAVDSQNSQEAEGEHDAVINLEKDDQKVDKLSPAQEQAQRQEEAWLLKVTSGKANVEDAPKWLQARLNSKLEATDETPDIEAVVQRSLAKEREDAEFKDLQSQIPALTQSQADELQERYKALRPAGRVAALRATLDAMGLSSKLKEAEARGIAKGKMSLPRSGQPAVKKSDNLIGGVPEDVINDDKKWAEYVARGDSR